MMETSTVTKKGQIVIPAPLRRRLGFEEGTKVVVTETSDGGVKVQPLDLSYFEQFAGILGGEGDATAALLHERNRDKDRENRRP